LLDGGLAREAERLALDDQVVPDPSRLIAEPIPELGFRAGPLRQARSIGLGGRLAEDERVEALVERSQPVECRLESLPRPAERLGLCLADLLLDAGESRRPLPGPIAGRPREVVPPHVHARPPLTR
jgi:hypothetical protein